MMNIFFQLVNILPFMVQEKPYSGHSTYGETSEKDQEAGKTRFPKKLLYCMIRHMLIDKRASLTQETRISNINLTFKTSSQTNKQAIRPLDASTMTHTISNFGILCT